MTILTAGLDLITPRCLRCVKAVDQPDSTSSGGRDRQRKAAPYFGTIYNIEPGNLLALIWLCEGALFGAIFSLIERL